MWVLMFTVNEDVHLLLPCFIAHLAWWRHERPGAPFTEGRVFTQSTRRKGAATTGNCSDYVIIQRPAKLDRNILLVGRPLVPLLLRQLTWTSSLYRLRLLLVRRSGAELGLTMTTRLSINTCAQIATLPAYTIADDALLQDQADGWYRHGGYVGRCVWWEFQLFT